jgi:hypothetical protein
VCCDSGDEGCWDDVRAGPNDRLTGASFCASGIPARLPIVWESMVRSIMELRRSRSKQNFGQLDGIPIFISLLSIF